MTPVNASLLTILAIIVIALAFVYDDWAGIGVLCLFLAVAMLSGCGGGDYPARDPCDPLPGEAAMCETCPGVCK